MKGLELPIFMTMLVVGIGVIVFGIVAEETLAIAFAAALVVTSVGMIISIFFSEKKKTS